MKNLNRKGFTMVELLIVLAIIAILAAVAIPVYSSQLEASRKKVDESNLRAATGIAAQAILLADPGLAPNQLVWKDRRYLVFTYEDTANSNNDKANAKNMLVFRDRGTVDENGNWYESWNHNLPTGTKVAFYTNSYSSNDIEKNAWKNATNLTAASNKANAFGGGGSQGSGMINGKKVIPFPLQQNKGNARFSIVVSRKGEVVESRILTNGSSAKISVDW